MCGIAGFILNPRYKGSFPAERFGRELLLAIEHRGKHATGFIATQNGEHGPLIHMEKQPLTASDFVKTFGVKKETTMALLHTRYKTQGDPKDNCNNHPVVYKSCFVTHNGAIWNDRKIIEEAEVNRVGEVDSFAIPVALEENGWDNTAHIKKALGSIEGHFAIAATDPVNFPGRVLLARGEGVGNPLHVLHTPQGLIWASEEKAIVDTWGKILGTPPKRRANRAGALGLYYINPGEYWNVFQDEKGLHIEPGLFKTARGSWTMSYGNNRHQPFASRLGPHHHQVITRESESTQQWTCWPNDENCIFGEECGNCLNEKCRCREGNKHHPRLNKGLSYKELIHNKDMTGGEYKLNFHRHVQKMHLTEDMLAPLASVHTLSPNGTNTSGSSSSATTRDLSEWNPTSGAYIKCSFCEHMRPEVAMHLLKKEGEKPKLICTLCQEFNLNSTSGHDRRLDPILGRFLTAAKRAIGQVEQAIVETADEHELENELVRYIVLYQPAQKDIPDYHRLQMEVKESFKVNLCVIQELDKREEVQ